MSDTMKMFLGILGAGIFFTAWSYFKISAFAKVFKKEKKQVALIDLVLRRSESGFYQLVAGILLILFSFIYLAINQ